MKARDPYLDVSRGIGILLVLLWHSHCLHIFSYLINMCFLPLFFVITGYLCSQQLDIQNIQIFQYAKDRAKRILIPYLKYNIILLGFYCVQVLVTDKVFNVNYLFGIVYSRYYILSDGVRLMSMSDICNAQLWFLPCMYLVSVLFYYIQKVQNDLSVVMTMLFFIALTVLFSFLPVLLPWSLDTLPICIIFCEFGMVIKNLKLLDSRLYGWKTILSTTMLGILYFIIARVNRSGVNLSIKAYGEYGVLSIFMYIVAGCIGSFLILRISKTISKIHVGRAFEFLGKNTLPILAFHVILNELFNKYCSKYFDLTSVFQNYLMEWCRVAFSLIVIILIMLTVKKIKKILPTCV